MKQKRSTVPPCLRPKGAVARDLCNGRTRPGLLPRKEGSAGGSGGVMPPRARDASTKRIPLWAPLSRFRLRQCRFRRYYTTNGGHCQGISSGIQDNFLSNPPVSAAFPFGSELPHRSVPPRRRGSSPRSRRENSAFFINKALFFWQNRR